MAQPIPVTVRVSVTNINSGEYVKIENVSTGEKKSVKADGDGGATVAFSNSSAGDTIVAYVSGRLTGNASGTVSKGVLKLSVTGSADTSTPGVSL